MLQCMLQCYTLLRISQSNLFPKPMKDDDDEDRFKFDKFKLELADEDKPL